MAVLVDEHKQWLDGNLPIVNGKVFVGTQGNNPTTGYPDAPVNLITIYSDRELTTAITNPQATDADGRTVNKIWIPDVEYSLVVWDSDDVQKYISLNEGKKAGELKVSDIAELKTTEGDYDGQFSYVAGYYSTGDGGGGDFYWAASSTETADDGMIVQVTGVTTGRWKRPEGEINAFHYGATGDGVDSGARIIAYIQSLPAGGEAVFLGNNGETYNSTIQLTHTTSFKLVGIGSPKLTFNIVSSTTDCIDFPWSVGKPDNNGIENITIDAQDTGQDVIVMRGINWKVKGLVILNAGRDGFSVQTNETQSWFVENFSIRDMEIDTCGRNGLAFHLRLKLAGSFINEGYLSNVEIRDCGNNGTGTEIKFIVPENTYPACKIANIYFNKGNIDQRIAARTEPYCIMIDKDSGVTNGATVELIKFDSWVLENTTATIAGSSAFYIDTGCDNIPQWDIDRVVLAGGISNTFQGTSFKRLWFKDVSGRSQFGDSGTIALASTTANQLVVTESGNDGDAGISIITANNKLASLFFGDLDDGDVAGFIYSHTANQIQVKVSGSNKMLVDTDGSLLPVTSGTPALGSPTARFGNGHMHRLSLTDGISAPATVLGQAYIYVDTTDGDLKIKFGDGVIKTITTDV